MDASRDIIESAKPPKPPRPGRQSEPMDGDRRMQLLVMCVAVCALASAVFTGITAWEAHQDRVNTEVVYCSLFLGSDPGGETDALRKVKAELGC